MRELIDELHARLGRSLGACPSNAV
jgi:hypothetical protein